MNQLLVLMHSMFFSNKNANFFGIKYLNKTISHANHLHIPVKVQHLADDTNLTLIIYADTIPAHGNLDDGANKEEYFFSLVGEHNKCNLCNWQSKR